MRLTLIALLILMLLRPQAVMTAAGDACALFARSVLPGLLPYMTLSLMLVSRVTRMNPLLLTLLGWGGGSPTGGRLLSLCPGLTARERAGLAVRCATMSPMFLLGTIGGWLASGVAGVCVLAGVLAGAAVAGALAGLVPRRAAERPPAPPPEPLSLGQAVEQTARTMLMVCGTMALMRVLAALAEGMTGRALPWLALPLTTLMEVTTGTYRIAALPLPLPLRAAVIAGATGFGGLAVILQNRAVWPEGLLSLPEQLLWQAVHGGASFLTTLGLMQLLA
ncbi:MAG: hypothetical protein ACI4ML_04860 [Aristaeellaceae bacterium]